MVPGEDLVEDDLVDGRHEPDSDQDGALEGPVAAESPAAPPHPVPSRSSAGASGSRDPRASSRGPAIREADARIAA